MALIRVLEIENFRAVKSLHWLPGPGINCLVGPGDSGKSMQSIFASVPADRFRSLTRISTPLISAERSALRYLLVTSMTL